MRPCASSADCRPGYFCGIVELFPGQAGTPASPEPVCWTVCQPGIDQSCNDNPIWASIHGACEADGTCTCLNGNAKNPKTGRCL